MPEIANEYSLRTYKKINLTGEEFYKALHQTPPYHYFASLANDLSELYNDLYPLEPFMVKNSSFDLKNSHLHRFNYFFQVWIQLIFF